MKKAPPMITIACVTLLMTSCASTKLTTTFNPDAVYRVPASGMWTEGLIDHKTGKRQGRMLLIPGTMVWYRASEISSKE